MGRNRDRIVTDPSRARIGCLGAKRPGFPGAKAAGACALCLGAGQSRAGRCGQRSEAGAPAHDYGAPPHVGRLFRERFHWVPFRHPRIDWAASAEVYRDIGAWASARLAPRPTALGDQPSGKPRQADGKFAGALDEAKRERSVG
jgi:hypothetical protein